MPKPLMDLATFNARYHAGRLHSGGLRHTLLVDCLQSHASAMASGGKNYGGVSQTLYDIIEICGEIKKRILEVLKKLVCRSARPIVYIQLGIHFYLF